MENTVSVNKNQVWTLFIDQNRNHAVTPNGPQARRSVRLVSGGTDGCGDSAPGPRPCFVSNTRLMGLCELQCDPLEPSEWNKNTVTLPLSTDNFGQTGNPVNFFAE